MLIRKKRMKTPATIALVVVLAMGIAYFAFAGEHPGMAPGKPEGKMMGPGMAGCPMHMMKCGHLMKAEITGTQDGGVVVMCCNKLYKYDKDLNMVKSVEMKEVKEDCKKMTDEMKKECMEKCPMMKEGEKK